MSIDREAVVRRHTIELTAPDARHALTVGNGDFGFTADVSGLQSFTAFHDPAAAMARAAAQRDGAPQSALESEPVLNTPTMSSWAWHEMPNPDGFVLDDAMTAYETSRGPVRYADRYDMVATMTGAPLDDADRAGAWLHVNPQRIDLGRLGIELRRTIDADAETDPFVLTDVRQTLDLWTGSIESSYSYDGEPVQVTTVAASEGSTIAARVRTALLNDGRARLTLRFPYASDGFFQTSDWSRPERHTSTLQLDASGDAHIDRQLDDTSYRVSLRTDGTTSATEDPHAFSIRTSGESLEIVVAFAPADTGSALPTFAEVVESSRVGWQTFWEAGAAVDFAESRDPRASELERRVVLSQYLTKVHCSGVMPPQETGLLTNSWQGKFHLEMHWWHAAHFAIWGRADLLVRSFDWYLATLDAARGTAREQGYPGARWPKQVGPDGRESPTPIGSLLIWQQPHILHLLELAWNAVEDEPRAGLVERYAELVDETAAFMAAFVEERDAQFHLGPPVMPAQEFYDARTTSDPTFELAYWWLGLEIAQVWRQRQGLERRAAWTRVQEHLAAPLVVDGHYAAVASSTDLRRDDHPSLLAALGVLPRTPVIDPAVMDATLVEVLDTWEWDTAWGWDFPVLAMAAARTGRTDLAVDALLRPEAKNTYSRVGHNPQMGALLPAYLPGNGGLLAAVALLATGADDGTAPSFPAPGWAVRAERFPPRP